MKRKFIRLAVLCLAINCTLSTLAGNLYKIYPVPHQQNLTDESTTIVKNKIQILCGEQIDSYTKERIKNILIEHKLISSTDNLFVNEAVKGYTHIYIGVNKTNDIADVKTSELSLSREIFSLNNKYDKHLLSIQSKDGHSEIVVLGENTDAAFIGMASLEQILDEYAATGALSCGVIYDYADQKYRGIVEGYYGVPYSIDVKKDIMKFMMRYKMNSYMYGAKSDYYHSKYWKQPYPTTITEDQRKIGYLSQDMVKELSQVSHETKVNFIWAIHPGDDFLNSSSVISDIMTKYRKMYALGVRQFAVFVDDVAIPSKQEDFDLNAKRVTYLQKSIENEWNKKNLSPSDTVKPLQFVPQIYCGGFANSEEQRKGFFTALSKTPSNIVIYTTGWGVWSVPNSSDVQSVRQYLGRDVAWWWNYPCNDNDADKIFPMDMYSNFHDESHISNSATVDKSLKNCLAVLSNPMQQGEVSKIALFGVADYAWNNAAFNNKNNWNDSFNCLLNDKELADAYHFLAPYLRYYDSESLTSIINTYKNSVKLGKTDASTLIATMHNILNASSKLEKMESSDNESERLLFNDLSPWLKKLHSMASQTLSLLESSELINGEEKWNVYSHTIQPISELTTNNDYKAPHLAGAVGSTLSLTNNDANPAEQALRPFITYLQDNALGDILGEKTTANPVIFTNLSNYKGSIAKTKTSISFANSCVNTLEKGDFLGVEMPQPVQFDEIYATDTLTQSFTLLYSENGKKWEPYNKEVAQQKRYIKYFVVLNEDNTPKAVKLARAILRFTLPENISIAGVTIPSGDTYDNHVSANMIDGDYSTYTCLNQNQKNNDAYTIKLQKKMPIGDVRICMGTVNGDYMTMGRVQISSDQKTWKNLNIKGTTRTDFRMNLPQVVKYSDEMSYCDFEGKNDSAQYVRLLVATANTSKWLRLYDIEINKATYASKFEKTVITEDGNAIESLIDKLAYTGISESEFSKSNYFIYNLFNAKRTNNLTFYQAPTTDWNADAEISVLTLDGQVHAIGKLTGGCQTFSLTDFEDPVSVKVEWNGKITPVIYEIKESLTEDITPIVSDVKQIIDVNTNMDISINNQNSIQVRSKEKITNVALYSIDGKQIYSNTFEQTNQVIIPKLNYSSQKAILLVVINKHNQKRTFKLIFK